MRRKIVGYEVVSEDWIGDINEKVQDLIDDGWEIRGHMQIGGRRNYTQVCVKYEIIVPQGRMHGEDSTHFNEDNFRV